jgi:hypothetical protein
MGLRNHDPYFWNQKIDPVSDIRNMGIITAGDVYWVSSVSDSDHTARIDAYGRKVVKTGYQAAVDASVDDANDYILAIPSDANGTTTIGTALDINKDRVHLLALGNSKAKNSYSVSVIDAFGTLPDTEVVAVTGHGVEVGGMRFVGTLGTNDGGTRTQGVLYLSGHDFYAHDSVFEDSTTLWGTPPVIYGGGTVAHDARFDECDIKVSTSQDEASGAVPVVFGGHGNKRWEFNDCKFRLAAGSTTSTIFTGGTGAKEYTLFNRCFMGLVNGTAFAVASALRGSVTANSPILLNDCTALGFTAFGTDVNVKASPNQAGTNGAGFHNPGIYVVGTGIAVVA